jgi:hypothetical protein
MPHLYAVGRDVFKYLTLEWQTRGFLESLKCKREILTIAMRELLERLAIRRLGNDTNPQFGLEYRACRSVKRQP